MSAPMVNPLLGRAAEAVTPIRMGGATGRVGEFGNTRQTADGKEKAHHGLDLLCTMAWPVFAAHDGLVSVAGWENPVHTDQGYGQRVKIQGAGVRTVYAHLSKILVKVGDTVQAGSLVGIAGRTGNIGDNPSIPTHLHFEVQFGVAWTPVDPAKWLMGEDA